jgi:hypothetical protein
MPSSYVIDKERKLVITTAWGDCNADDVLEFRKQVLRDRDFDPSFSQLADFTGVTKVDVSPDEVRMLATKSPFSTQSRRALVADNQVIFGLSKMFGILRNLRGEKLIRVFRTRSEALDWLLEKDKAA